MFSAWNNLLTVKHAAPNLGRIWTIWFSSSDYYHFSHPEILCLKFVFIVSSMNSSAHFTANGAGTDYFGVNFANFIFFSIKTDLLEANYLYKLMQNLFYV